MIDFTKKGTKLPIIPIGTEYKVQDGGICNKIYNHIDFVSFGMVDDIWLKCESSNYISKTNHYLIKLSTIERLAKEQGMYNPNNEQMKTQVTLNAYGGVVVTENNTTTIHSKETALQIYEVVKADFEKGKPTIELNKWNYWDCKEDDVKMLLFITNIDNENKTVIGYGFRNDEWVDECNCYCNPKNFNDAINNFTPAPTETVETALRNEAIKRGYKKGVKVSRPKTFVNKGIAIIEDDKFKPLGAIGFQMGGTSIFENGKFATIIQPETISIQEAEKILGKKIK